MRALNLPVAALVAIGLAGCGGGGGIRLNSETACVDAGGQWNANMCVSAETLAIERAVSQTEALMTAARELTATIARFGRTPNQADIYAAINAATNLSALIDAASSVDAAVIDGYRQQLASANAFIIAARDASIISEATQAAQQAVRDAQRAATQAQEAAAQALRAAQQATQQSQQGSTTTVNTDLAADNTGLTADQAAIAARAQKIHHGLTHSILIYPSASNNPTTLEFSHHGNLVGTVKADTESRFVFRRTDTPMRSLGAWAGAEYTQRDGSTVDRAVIYTNQEPPTREIFATKHAAILTNRRIEASNVEHEDNTAWVASASFAAGATGIDHTTADGQSAAIRGTFDGGAGTYHCQQSGSATCRSRVDGEGGILLSGGWSFEPDSGTVAVTPDAEYIYFGWWTRETSDEIDIFPLPSGGAVGEGAMVNLISHTTTAFERLTGIATYSGGAAGMYVIYDQFGSNSEYGTFTAKVAIEADFRTDAIVGIASGMIDDFIIDGERKNWTVELLPTNLFRAVGSTAWSIDGETFVPDGYYRTRFRGAGSSVADAPKTMVGDFSAGHGPASFMIGSYGANLDE